MKPDSILSWRLMRTEEVEIANEISDLAQTEYPERPEIFEERQMLFPKGALVLSDQYDVVFGYCISHPWDSDRSPKLDTLIHWIPVKPTCYFVHDVGIARSVQARGYVQRLAEMLYEVAREYKCPEIRAVSVNGTLPLWKRIGAVVSTDEDLLRYTKLAYDKRATPIYFNIEKVAPVAFGH